ncbi:MAG: PIN domain-containing protein [Thermoplasmatota archaeon]|nr:PIN domain-containing protein [Halobacteriales archaeon]
MTEVLFDTWAWWEVAMGTRTGARLQARYLAKGKVVTSAWALGEIVCKLEGRVAPEVLDTLLRRIRLAGRLVDVSPPIAVEGARLRASLRLKASHASLGDGVMLATARHIGARLVSGDAAFVGERDVVR